MNINKLVSKRILIYILLLSFTSCEKFLTDDPITYWDADQFFENQEELDMGLAGVYNALADPGLYGEVEGIILDTGTDEGVYSRNYNEAWPTALYRHTAADQDLEDAWLAYYEGVNRANSFISKVEKSEWLESDYKNEYLAEVHFLRGIFYLDLVRNWGEVPLRLKPTEGVEDNNFPASPIDSVYSQIVKDFQFAITYLPHANESRFIPGHANKMAARGLLARAYLTMAGYPLRKTEMYAKASAQCDSIIQDGWHSLNPSYKDIFLNMITNQHEYHESMFEVEFTNMRDMGIQVDGKLGNLNGIQFSYGGEGYPYSYGFVQATVALKNRYKGADERYDWNIASFKYTKDEDHSEIYRITNELALWPGKYRRWEPMNWDDVDDKKDPNGEEKYVALEPVSQLNKNFTGINFPLLRYSDIILMKAECENEINGPSSASTYLNQIRSRAGLDDIDPSLIGTQESFREEIQDERSREFCFEGMRRFDLIRWGIMKEALLDANEQTKSSESYKPGSTDEHLLRAGENFDPTKNLLFPYPLQEVTLNNSLNQHAGW